MIEVPKTDFRKSHVEPIPAWGIDSGGEVFIRCGGCGMCMGLDHEISAEGIVTPSVFHDEPPKCNWHVSDVKLMGWDLGAKDLRK